jgi:hypothetical protein
MSQQDAMQELLLSYIRLLAEHHSRAPDSNFEYDLWDDLHQDPRQLTPASREERNELIFLAINTDSWVTCNLDTGMFQLIDMHAWMLLLQKRGH